MHALIFANGELELPSDWQALAARADLIIAADGGAAHCGALGLLPDVLIGDLDSVDASLRAELEEKEVKLVTHPREKDATDFELAVAHAQEAGASELTVLAGLGRRWDHSLANLLLAAQPRFANLQITFLQSEQRLHVLRGASVLDAQAGERVSLLALGGDAKKVSTEGLQYTLTNETLLLGSSRGVSNIALQDAPRVSVADGVLLCVISPNDLD